MNYRSENPLDLRLTMSKLKIPILVAFLVLFCQPVLLAESKTVGIMTLNKGVVKLRRNLVDSVYRKVGETVPVSNLDEIQTGKDSNVTIELKAKDDKLELYSQSFFKIDQVTPESSSLSMSIGKARFKIKKGIKPRRSLKKRRKRFRVRTANAIVGVKGTEFVMAAGTDVTSVLTIEGTVDVASVSAPDIEVEVGENQASQIKQAAPPTKPVTVPPSIKEDILNADTPNAFNKVTFGETVSTSDVKQDSKKKNQASQEKTTSQKNGPAAKGTPKTTGTGVSAGQGATTLLPGSDSENPDEKDSTASGSEGSTVPGQADDPESSQEGVFGAETGDDDTFTTEDGAATPGGDDAINLETIETAELEEIDVEEPEIDPDDIFDIDTLIEDIEDNTDELQEEIEEIQEEILENQLQEIKIRIKHQ